MEAPVAFAAVGVLHAPAAVGVASLAILAFGVAAVLQLRRETRTAG